MNARRFYGQDRKRLEAAAWAKKHRDFKGKGADGVRRMNYLNPATGATESWPLGALPEEELMNVAGLSKPCTHCKVAAGHPCVPTATDTHWQVHYRHDVRHR